MVVESELKFQTPVLGPDPAPTSKNFWVGSIIIWSTENWKPIFVLFVQLHYFTNRDDVSRNYIFDG